MKFTLCHAIFIERWLQTLLLIVIHQFFSNRCFVFAKEKTCPFGNYPLKKLSVFWYHRPKTTLQKLSLQTCTFEPQQCSQKTIVFAKVEYPKHHVQMFKALKKIDNINTFVEKKCWYHSRSIKKCIWFPNQRQKNEPFQKYTSNKTSTAYINIPSPGHAVMITARVLPDHTGDHRGDPKRIQNYICILFIEF